MRWIDAPPAARKAILRRELAKRDFAAELASIVAEAELASIVAEAAQVEASDARLVRKKIRLQVLRVQYQSVLDARRTFEGS